MDPSRGNLASKNWHSNNKELWVGTREVLLHLFETILLVQARDTGNFDQVVEMKMGVSERI